MMLNFTLPTLALQGVGASMDKVTADRITEIAPSIQKFLDLAPEEQEWLFPLLGKAEKRAILILEEIQGHHLTYVEIAKLTNSHPNTVKMFLYALEDGGLAYKSGSTNKWLSSKGGRKRKLVVK